MGGVDGTSARARGRHTRRQASVSPCLRLSRWGRAPPPRGLPNSRRSGWGPRSGHGGFGVWRGHPPPGSQAASHRGDLAWRKAREGSLGAPYRDPNPITGPRDLVAAQGPRLLTSAGQDSTCGLWGTDLVHDIDGGHTNPLCPPGTPVLAGGPQLLWPCKEGPRAGRPMETGSWPALSCPGLRPAAGPSPSLRTSDPQL